MTRAKDISKIVTDANLSGTLDVTGDLTVDTSTLKVDSTNNRVGINTTGSVRDLQIGDNTRSASILSLQTNSTGNGSIYFGDNTTTNAEYGGMIRYSHSDNAMLFWTSSTERMRITSDGNVGIGTTSPSAALHILDTSTPQAKIAYDSNRYMNVEHATIYNVSGAAQSNNLKFATRGYSGNNNITFFTGGTDASGTSESERMRIDSSGKVGIGTSSPFSTLSASVDSNAPSTSGNMSSHGVTIHNSSGGRAIQMGVNESGAYNYIQSSYVNNADVGVNLAFFTGASERMRIDNSGNVGIGTDSPHSIINAQGSGTAGAVLTLENSNTALSSGNTLGSIEFYSNDASTNANGVRAKINANASSASGATDIIFSNTVSADTTLVERMRIVSDGSVVVGKTEVADATNGIQLRVLGDGTILGSTRTSGEACMLNRNGSSGTLAQFKFQGSVCGTISVNTNSTAYNTSSDYRLKENVTADWDATTRLKQLNPVRFNFIADADTTVDGFLAHEVQSVVPEAITGTHNEVDADGNPVYQGIDQSKLVPLLVKTIQELEARITALENGE